MNSRYKYLEKYKAKNNQVVEIWRQNIFMPVINSDISTSEQKIGFAFPKELKEFWLEIGCGHLTTPVNASDGYNCVYANYILSPQEIASIILGEEDAPMLPEYREDLTDDDIPFFEVGDSSSYIFMRKNTDKIYYMHLYEVADSLEEFIYKLYYESPAYYLWIGKEEEDPYKSARF